MSRMSSGIEPLAGFFELWLRDEAAALMCKGAEDSWRDHVEHRSAGVPARFTLDGAVCDARQISPEKSFAWARNLSEVIYLDAWVCGMRTRWRLRGTASFGSPRAEKWELASQKIIACTSS